MLDHERPEEKRRIGREIKNFLAVHGIDRQSFADKCGIGKSTVDKLVTGIFSERTILKVVEKSSFKLKTNYASKHLGAYSRENWIGYLRDYLMLHPALAGGGNIVAKLVSITWDEMLPGMILKEPGTVIGALWIPHERSPLIYIQPVNDIGVRLVISTMVGEPCMRGLLLTVDNVVANAYIPVSLPVVFKRLDVGKAVPSSDLGVIKNTHPLYQSYMEQIVAVIDKQFGRMVSLNNA